jgi:hypothetical protein
MSREASPSARPAPTPPKRRSRPATLALAVAACPASNLAQQQRCRHRQSIPAKHTGAPAATRCMTPPQLKGWLLQAPVPQRPLTTRRQGDTKTRDSARLPFLLDTCTRTARGTPHRSLLFNASFTHTFNSHAGRACAQLAPRHSDSAAGIHRELQGEPAKQAAQVPQLGSGGGLLQVPQLARAVE